MKYKKTQKVIYMSSGIKLTKKRNTLPKILELKTKTKSNGNYGAEELNK